MSEIDIYPFVETLRKRLKEKPGTVGWLAGEIGRTPRWIERLTGIDDVTVKLLNNISTALEFDFIADYLRWKNGDAGDSNAVAEPTAPYRAIKQPVSLNIRITGSAADAGKILTKIQEDGAKMGFKIE